MTSSVQLTETYMHMHDCVLMENSVKVKILLCQYS